MAKELAAWKSRSKYVACPLANSSSSSSFGSNCLENCINRLYTLKRWCIKPSIDGKICFYGCVDDTGTVWKNITVESRIDEWTVQSLSGSVYRLHGPMDEEASLRLGVPSYVVNAMHRGLPKRWKVVLARRNQTCEPEILEVDSICREFNNHSHGMVTRSNRMQSFSARPRTKPTVEYGRRKLFPKKEIIFNKILKVELTDIAKSSFSLGRKVDSKPRTVSVNHQDKLVTDSHCKNSQVSSSHEKVETCRDLVVNVQNGLECYEAKASCRDVPKSQDKCATRDCAPEKKVSPPKENVAFAIPSPAVLITATKGTLKRKRQIKDLLRHVHKANVKDFFDSTPLRSKKRRLDGLTPCTNSPVSHPDFKTPVALPNIPSPFSAIKAPPPSEVIVNAEEDDDKYIYHTMKWRKEKKPKRKRNLNTPVAPRKSKNTDYSQFFSMLKSKTPEADDGEEDFYFTEDF